MATYVLLSNLTDEGAKTIKSNPGRIKEVNKELDALGVKVVAQYAILGPYDFVNIVEAPDNATMMRVSAEMVLAWEREDAHHGGHPDGRFRRAPEVTAAAHRWTRPRLTIFAETPAAHLAPRPCAAGENILARAILCTFALFSPLASATSS